MTKTFQFDGYDLDISFRKNLFSKSIRISITKKGVIVTLPKYTSYKVAYEFAITQKSWILKHIDTIKNNKKNNADSKLEYRKLKKTALDFATKRLEYFNQFYNYKYNKISIKNQKSRWGSCSSNKNLSFNYKIIKLDPKLADYLIVHELCHLKEMNHSKDFYDLIAKTIPNHKTLQKKLKKLP